MAADKMISVVGIHAVKQVLVSNPEKILQLYVRDGSQPSRLAQLGEIAQRHGLTVQLVPKATLDKMADGAVHQGVVAVVRRSEVVSANLEQICQQKGKDVLLLVLDGVEDPHNLGACLRSAAAAGVDAVILPERRAVGVNHTVQRVACGAVELVPVCVVKNIARTLKKLQDAGLWVVGCAEHADKPIYDLRLTGPLVMVMGGEEKGLRQLTQKHCDFMGKIPTMPNFSSLNVSVATGIALFEAVRQRS